MGGAGWIVEGADDDAYCPVVGFEVLSYEGVVPEAAKFLLEGDG